MSDALRMHVRPQLRDSSLILAFEGWNDAGEAATSALRFIDEALHCVPLAEIDSEEFYDYTVRRPLVAEDEQGRYIEWPSNEFRYGSADAAREIVIGIGVEPHLRWRYFCRCVAELSSQVGVKRVVLLGAYLADVVYSQPVQVTGFASDPKLLDEISVNGTHYQGPTGIVGVLSDWFEREGLETLSLWAGLPHYINASPNPRGALALVQKVTACLDLKLDEAPLRRSAAEFEERISQLVAGDAELAEYVRQLKKREFAQ